MASRLRLNGDPYLPFIYNVGKHVGPGQDNNADDVELIQFLIAEIIRRMPGRISAPLPQVTRSYNLSTGFWIYEIEYRMDQKGKFATIDGVVSPARGPTGSYGGGKVWAIYALNHALWSVAPDVYANLPNDNRLSQSLRSSLSRA